MAAVSVPQRSQVICMLRRYFPGIADNAQARKCARIIAGWKQAMTLAECDAAVILAAVAGLGCM